MPRMTISVIIPAYKAARTIERALASVAAQTAKPGEVIVVDDGSEDGTFETAQAYTDKMNGIELKVYNQPNMGAGAARNHAINESKGDWLAFLDADDEWLPEKLSVSMKAIEENNLVLFSHNYISLGEGKETLVDCVARYQAAADPYVGLYRKGFLATSTVVVRRAAVSNSGGFDETLATAQDFDLWLKILKKGGAPFRVGSCALTRYHITQGSITSHTRRRLDCGLRIAKRHAPSQGDYRFRIIAVHYEAIMASLLNGRLLAALEFMIKLPARYFATFLGGNFGSWRP